MIRYIVNPKVRVPDFCVCMVGILGKKANWSLAQGAVEVYTPITPEQTGALWIGLTEAGFNPRVG